MSASVSMASVPRHYSPMGLHVTMAIFPPRATPGVSQIGAMHAPDSPSPYYSKLLAHPPPPFSLPRSLVPSLPIFCLPSDAPVFFHSSSSKVFVLEMISVSTSTVPPSTTAITLELA